jgi:hypothetical protein
MGLSELMTKTSLNSRTSSWVKEDYVDPILEEEEDLGEKILLGLH